MAVVGPLPERSVRTLGVVLTGGTLGSRRLRTGQVELQAAPRFPELDLVATACDRHQGLELSVVQPFRLPSEDMTPGHWTVLAGAVRDLAVGGADGILVLHGTDTAAYTTAALSFLVSDIRCPVVLTGANLPPDHPDSDAEANIRGALCALGALRAGVFLSFAGGAGRRSAVHLGTRVRKVATTGRTFASVAARPVGEVVDGVFVRSSAWEPPRRPPLDPRLDERVLALACHPGLDFAAVDRMVTREGLRGLVLELYPSATAPAGTAGPSPLVTMVENMVRRGGTVVGVAPDHAPPRYRSTTRLVDAGLVLVPSLLREVAVVKLMLALGQGGGPETVRELMLEPLAGEITTSVGTESKASIAELSDYRRG